MRELEGDILIEREREIEKDTMLERESKRDIVGVREND